MHSIALNSASTRTLTKSTRFYMLCAESIDAKQMFGDVFKRECRLLAAVIATEFYILTSAEEKTGFYAGTAASDETHKQVCSILPFTKTSFAMPT